MQNIIWIDVRTKEEFDNAHIDGAILIPLELIEEDLTSLPSDKRAKILLYCRTGRRSGIALNIMLKAGYKNVTNEGGYEEIITRTQWLSPETALSD